MLQKLTHQIVLLACLFALPSWAENEQTEEDLKQPEPITEAEYYLPNIPQKRAISLLEYMRLFGREDEIVELNTSEDSFYGLFLAEASGEPQGGILILHDNQQHGHWPDVIAPIREYLPLYGWTTLSIELPDLPAEKLPVRTEIQLSATEVSPEAEPIAVSESGEALAENENKVSENDNANDEEDNSGPAVTGDEVLEIEQESSKEENEPALPRLQSLPKQTNTKAVTTDEQQVPEIDVKLRYLQSNRDRILAAIEYLKSRGQFNLVILGYGVGASWAIDYAQSQTIDDPEQKGLTLVTVDAIPSRHTPQKMYQQINNLKIPFLDLIHPNQSSSLKSGVKRKRIMKRAKNSDYQQIITPNMASYEEDESPTSRRIRGWLKSNAGGTLVKMRQ